MQPSVHRILTTGKTWLASFLLLCIFFIPFPFFISKIQLRITDMFFGEGINVIASHLFGIELSGSYVYSDSVSMYALIIILFLLSVLILIILRVVRCPDSARKQFLQVTYQVCLYYLILQLCKYGADKIFTKQFYNPEPNILYSRFGNLDPDILYWSTIGSSPGYTIFLGTAELLAAILLLVRKTRPLGALISIGLMVNIVAINFGYNISVKLFSLLLLILSIYIASPFLKNYTVLVGGRKIVSTDQKVSGKSFGSIFLRYLAIGLIAFEVFYPFISTHGLGAGKSPKAFLHGAYQVLNVYNREDSTTAPPNGKLVRFYIHKDNYFIAEDSSGNMMDYKLSIDSSNKTFVLTDYSFSTHKFSYTYDKADSLISLRARDTTSSEVINAKAINWKTLPVMETQFRWMTDEGRLLPGKTK